MNFLYLIAKKVKRISISCQGFLNKIKIKNNQDILKVRSKVLVIQ